MRQIGITKDADNIYFKFPSFFEIYKEFVRINAMGPDFEVIEKPFEKNNNIRVEFNSNNPEIRGKGYGHYIIDGNHNAILTFVANVVFPRPERKDKTKIFSWVPKKETSVFFKRDESIGKYFINFAKRKDVLNFMNENQSIINTYEQEIILYTTESFGNDKVKSNVNEQKDIFKLEHPYSPTYWQSQNLLLLTDEMHNFIERMGKKNKEFKVRGNMK